jgi:hypothetical protein
LVPPRDGEALCLPRRAKNSAPNTGFTETMTDNLVYTLIRSKRRTLAIEIGSDGAILVRAPKRAAQKHIDAFIVSQQDWISRKRTDMVQRPQPEIKAYRDGETFLYLGESCRLCVVDQPKPAVAIEGTRLTIAASELPRAAPAVEKWYRTQARRVFGESIEKYGEIMGCRPSVVRITSPRLRWGSCGARGGINLNWRLIMAPPEIIDYIVVHELAHLKYRGHGRLFWDFVGRFCPEHRQLRKWLKDNGHGLYWL